MKKAPLPQGSSPAAKAPAGVDFEVVGEIDDEMLCPICHDPLAEPVLHQKCANMFCRGCLDGWRKTGKTCPICRDTLNDGDINHVVPRIVTNKLQSLRVRHTPCGTELPRSGLAGHRDVCPLSVISCTAAEYGCEWRAARNTLAQHHLSCPAHLLRHEFARIRCN